MNFIKKKESKNKMSESAGNILGVKYTPEEKLFRAKVQLDRQFAFFGYLAAYLKFRDVEKDPFKVPIDTLAVTSGTTVMYNPKYVAEIKDNDMVLGVLVHEVLHLAWKHNERQGNRNIMLMTMETMPDGSKVPRFVSLYNIAADIVINNVIVKNNIKLPESDLIPENDKLKIFGIELTNIIDLSAEEIYDMLAKELEKQCNKNKGKNQKGGNSISVSGLSPNKDSLGDKQPSDSDNPSVVYEMDNLPKQGDSHLWDQDSKTQKKEQGGNKDSNGEEQSTSPFDDEEIDWDKIVADATERAVRQGTLPAGMDREFKVVKTKRLNIDAFLRKTIGQFVPLDFTYSRPNKHSIIHDSYMPSTHGERIKILFSIDTSGSVTQTDLSKYISLITNIAKSHELSIEFRVLTHDVDVHDDYHVFNGNIEKIKRIKVHGGGGTSHIPLYKYITKKGYNKDTKLLISFTDGYSSYPERPPAGLRSLFILAGDHCAKNDMPKWGSVIEYKH